MLQPNEGYEDTLLIDRYSDLYPDEILELDIPAKTKARVLQLQLGALCSDKVMELPGERSLWIQAYTSLLGENGETRIDSH